MRPRRSIRTELVKTAEQGPEELRLLGLVSEMPASCMFPFTSSPFPCRLRISSLSQVVGVVGEGLYSQGLKLEKLL